MAGRLCDSGKPGLLLLHKVGLKEGKAFLREDERYV